MRETCQTGDMRPIPVILASDASRALWPNSSPEQPWCFRRHESGRSPVEELLAAFAADDRFSPPLVVAPCSAVSIASAQVSNWRQHGVHLMVVPDDLSFDACAALAALESSARGRFPLLALVPAAARYAPDLRFTDTLAKGTRAIAGSPRALVYTRRARPPACGLAFEPGATDCTTGLKTANAIRFLGGDEDDAAMLAAESLLLPAGPVICSAKALLDAVHRAVPMLVNSATNALHLADRSGQITHPHPGFLSLIPGGSFAEMIRFAPHEVLLDPAGAHMIPVLDWSDLDHPHSAEPGSTIVGVAGIGPHRVIHGPDGVFICADGHEHEAAAWYGARAASEPSRPFPHERREWGVEQLVQQDYGFRLLRLEIEPGGKLPPEYHFRRRETWAIGSGVAMVTIDGRVLGAKGGDLFTINPGAVHSLKNTGKENLVLYECRIGSLLGDEDRIGAEKETPRPAAPDGAASATTPA